MGTNPFMEGGLWLSQTLTGRLLGMVTLIVVGAMGLLLVVELRSNHEEILRSEQARLVVGASALAVGLDGDVLLSAETRWVPEDALEEWSAEPGLAAQHRRLARFVEQVGLTTDVYTLSIDPEMIGQVVAAPEAIHAEAMRCGVSSAQRPYWHHRYAYRPEMAPTLLWGREASTRIYEDENGVWVSAYAPVRSESGEVVALLALDAPLSHVRSLLVPRVLGGLAVLGSMLAGMLLAIGVASRRLTGSVWRLVAAAERFGRGDTLTPIPTGGPREVSVLGRALEAARQDLHEQVTQQRREAVVLTAALQRAQEASAARGEFLATVSHELRTPMNGVLGAVELLSRARMPPADRELLEIIRRSGQDMTSLIDDVLDFAQLEQDTIGLAAVSFSPRQIAQEALDRIAPQAASRGLTCRLIAAPEVPAAALGSAGRIAQILDQILVNAVKFTVSGRIVLHLTAEARMGTGAGEGEECLALRIAVEDTGVGIAADQRERIFEPFIQADGAMSRRYGGSGLGLSICQRLVRLLGGEIGVESVLGEGSTFWFVLPVYPVVVSEGAEALTPARQHRALAAEEVEALSTPHVLVAEDHPINQKIVVRLLEGLGCTCEIAEDGEQALALASQRRYSLVLMDCQMPRMDGLQATAAIRRLRPPWSEVPIVALTANTMDGDRERCLAAGMDDYLRKPVSAEHLAMAIDCWRLRRSA